MSCPSSSWRRHVPAVKTVAFKALSCVAPAHSHYRLFLLPSVASDFARATHNRRGQPAPLNRRLCGSTTTAEACCTVVLTTPLVASSSVTMLVGSASWFSAVATICSSAIYRWPRLQVHVHLFERKRAGGGVRDTYG